MKASVSAQFARRITERPAHLAGDLRGPPLQAASLQRCRVVCHCPHLASSQRLPHSTPAFRDALASARHPPAPVMARTHGPRLAMDAVLGDSRGGPRPAAPDQSACGSPDHSACGSPDHSARHDHGAAHRTAPDRSASRRAHRRPRPPARVAGPRPTPEPAVDRPAGHGARTDDAHRPCPGHQTHGRRTGDPDRARTAATDRHTPDRRDPHTASAGAGQPRPAL